MEKGRLSAFVARIGLREAAFRLGVTQATVGRWIRTGVSASKESDASGIIRRHERSVKGAATKRQVREESKKIIGSEPGGYFELPPRQKPGQNLTPAQLTPRTHPTRDIRAREQLGTQDTHWTPIDSDKWRGIERWFSVNQDYRAVNKDAWKELLVSEWLKSGLDYAMVKVFAATHMAYNPAYTGSAVRKKGTWRSYYVTTRPAATDESIASLIDYVFTFSRATDARAASEASIDAQAETRIVWIHRLHFRFFSSNEERRVSLTEGQRLLDEDLSLFPDTRKPLRSRKRRR